MNDFQYDESGSWWACRSDLCDERRRARGWLFNHGKSTDSQELWPAVYGNNTACKTVPGAVVEVTVPTGRLFARPGGVGAAVRCPACQSEHCESGRHRFSRSFSWLG